jgi:hypothetical protein
MIDPSFGSIPSRLARRWQPALWAVRCGQGEGVTPPTSHTVRTRPSHRKQHGRNPTGDHLALVTPLSPISRFSQREKLGESFAGSPWAESTTEPKPLQRSAPECFTSCEELPLGWFRSRMNIQFPFIVRDPTAVSCLEPLVTRLHLTGHS